MFTIQTDRLKKLAAADSTPKEIREELIDILTNHIPPALLPIAKPYKNPSQPWDDPYNARPFPAPGTVWCSSNYPDKC